MKQFRFYEKVAGVALLGGACLFGCKERPESDPLPSAEPKVEVGAADTTAKGPARWLGASIAGLARGAAPRIFGPSNLYELINGGADVFVDYGLVSMAVADYADKGKKGVTATVELYDMGSAAGAMGRAARNLAGLDSKEESGQGLPEEMKDRGQLGSGDLWVWQGQHLLHVTLLDESPDATAQSTAALGKELLPKVAEDVLALVPSLPAPQELAAFPKNGLIARSFQLWPAHCLDRKEMGPCWSASYGKKEDPFTAFILDQGGDAAKAEKLTSTLVADGVLAKAACGRTLGLVAPTSASKKEAAVLLQTLSASSCPSPSR
ncbi:MAG: hypothetical protein MUC50_15970 [Myxococcota bacterium]|nr:hypothetical protein [Myxococcota bacterium]